MPKKKKYNHAFDIAFEIESDLDDGSDITEEQFMTAIIKRALDTYNDGIIEECVGGSFDTYEYENEE